MKVRAVVECGGKAEHFASVEKRDWLRVTEWLREVLVFQLDRDRCASAVVAVHFCDERCDHEGP